jgi:hypothetical protein
MWTDGGRHVKILYEHPPHTHTPKRGLLFVAVIPKPKNIFARLPYSYFISHKDIYLKKSTYVPKVYYVLTPWSKVLLEKSVGAFYGTRRFITAFTSGRHPSLSSASEDILPYIISDYMVTDCLLFVTRLRIGRPGDRIPRGWGIFLFSKTVQTAPGAHPASYSIGNGVLPGLKLLKRDADHSTPSTAQVKNEWSCTSTPPICPHGMDRDKFKFYTYCWPLYRTAQAVCYSNAQYSTVKYSQVHYSKIRYNTQECTMVQFTAHHRSIYYSKIRYNTLQ